MQMCMHRRWDSGEGTKELERNSHIPMTRILIACYFVFTEECVHSKQQAANKNTHIFALGRMF